MIPGEIFTSFAGFQGIVSVNDFWFPLGLQDSVGSSGFPEKILCCTGWIVTTELPNLVPFRHIDDCHAILILH